jgi:hypothetical protein
LYVVSGFPCLTGETFGVLCESYWQDFDRHVTAQVDEARF